MPAPYSNDLRWKVINAHKNGEKTLAGLARRFNVSVDFIRDLLRRYEETGDVSAKPHNGGRSAEISGPKEYFDKLSTRNTSVV